MPRYSGIGMPRPKKKKVVEEPNGLAVLRRAQREFSAELRCQKERDKRHDMLQRQKTAAKAVSVASMKQTNAAKHKERVEYRNKRLMDEARALDFELDDARLKAHEKSDRECIRAYDAAKDAELDALRKQNAHLLETLACVRSGYLK